MLSSTSEILGRRFEELVVSLLVDGPAILRWSSEGAAAVPTAEGTVKVLVRSEF